MGADHDDGEEPLGRPLPPEDRLWRHPSEVGATLGPDATRGRRGWLGPAFAGLLVGGAAVLGLSSIDGGDDVDPGTERVGVDPVATLPVAAPPGTVRIGEAALAEVVAAVPTDDTWGSAVLYRDDGHLLTSADAVAGADAVSLHLGDGTRAEAEVVGVDAVLGVAVLHAEAVVGRAGMTLGQSRALEVGDRARLGGADRSGVAVGDQGVVNELAASGVDGSGAVHHGLLRIDVPTEAGPGGHAVLDARARLVGITVGGGPGPATFAVPIDDARQSADEIIAQGWAAHSWLGLQGMDLEPVDARDLGVPGAAVVSEVAPDSPAHRAGLAPDDVIVSIDGQPVHSIAALVVAVRRHRAGDEVEIDYLRDGDRRTCEPVLAERAATA